MSGNQYLFLFTIGPVQSFIAQARKTRDLYAGSKILGEIIDAAMKYAQKEYGAEIIVPDSDSDAKPNRFLAKITWDVPKEFAKDVEKTARAQWVDIALRSFTNAGVCHAPETNGFDESQKRLIDCTKLEQINPAETKKQIEDFLEVYWVLLELDGAEDYKEKHDEIQKLLAAIKNTRQFEQIREPAGRKCALDGERNALFFLPTVKDEQPRFIQDRPNEIGKKRYLLSPGEGLSAVSLVKRFYAKGEKFPSTAEVALMNVLGEIDDSKKENYKKPFGGYFDEQLYYEENLTTNYFRKRGLEGLIDQLPALQEERKALFGGHKQSKYYAFIAFDGDDMGKVWAGKILADKENLDEFQPEMSRLLQQFQELLAFRLGIYAAYATAYLNGNIRESEDGLPEKDIWRLILRDESYRGFMRRRDDETQKVYESRLELNKNEKGRTVYAGGDDFLGLINLKYLFAVMQELRVAYEKLVYEPLASSDKFLIEKPLTFSAGVTIAHYKEPLGEVLRYVRQAEHDAKDIDEDKDAFSLVVLKGSGEMDKIRCKWYLGDSECFTKVLQEVVRQLLDEKNGFTSTFIKNIDREFRPLMDKKGFYPDGDQMLRKELLRLLTRSAVNKETVKSSVANFNAFVLRLYDNDYCMENFFSGLHICDFLKRELKNNASS